jgi:fluoride exporter
MSLPVWIGIALLGGVGALARFAADGALSLRFGRSFPVGTLIVNLSGALALGLLVGLGVKGDALALAGTATLGSYTTFSTWMFETQRLAEDGELWLAWLNIGLSLALGVAAAAVAGLT